MLSFSKCGIFKLGTGCEWSLFSQILKLPGPLRVTTLMFYYFFLSVIILLFQLREGFSMLSFSKCGIFKFGTGFEWRLFSQILKLPGPLRVTTFINVLLLFSQ